MQLCLAVHVCACVTWSGNQAVEAGWVLTAVVWLLNGGMSSVISLELKVYECVVFLPSRLLAQIERVRREAT